MASQNSHKTSHKNSFLRAIATSKFQKIYRYRVRANFHVVVFCVYYLILPFSYSIASFFLNCRESKMKIIRLFERTNVLTRAL